jgi:alkanesulfonate monooxygenase SsuD/methylene tetrahydromethanopterin reductase-like flavin-dependent oxidoreductase (luciferase family)
MPRLETGIQFHLPTYAHVSLPNLVDLGKKAEANGVGQIWVTDNLRSRNSFVVLAALACSLKIKLGTAITVQYFRNPVDLADMVASLSELMDGRELSIGLGFGNPRTHNWIKTPKPISFLRETSQSLRRLLDGESVCFADYPVLLEYFNFNSTASFKLNFSLKSPVLQYCGGNGPLGLAVGGQYMEGLIFGGHYMAALLTGRVPSMIQAFDDAAVYAGKINMAPKVAEIKISVSRDRQAAREFVKESAGNRVLNMYRQGYSHEDIQNLGVNLEDVAKLDEADKVGVSPEGFDALVTDDMVDAIFIAGEPGDCLARMVEIYDIAQSQGFHQVMFSELGPDVDEALGLLVDEIIPAL